MERPATGIGHIATKSCSSISFVGACGGKLAIAKPHHRRHVAVGGIHDVAYGIVAQSRGLIAVIVFGVGIFQRPRGDKVVLV